MTKPIPDGQDGFIPHLCCSPCGEAMDFYKAAFGAQEVSRVMAPDGTRVMFVPYPTPIVNEAGDLMGAVNMLIDVTDVRQAEALKAQAVRCKRLAKSISDERAISTLNSMAREYEEEAMRLVPRSVFVSEA